MVSCNFCIGIWSRNLEAITVNQMTMICHPIPFAELVQKNNEPIMGVCGKIFIICTICKCCSCCELNKNFQNVYPPAAQTWRPTDGRRSVDALQDTGRSLGLAIIHFFTTITIQNTLIKESLISGRIQLTRICSLHVQNSKQWILTLTS